MLSSPRLHNKNTLENNNKKGQLEQVQRPQKGGGADTGGDSRIVDDEVGNSPTFQHSQN